MEKYYKCVATTTLEENIVSKESAPTEALEENSSVLKESGVEVSFDRSDNDFDQGDIDIEFILSNLPTDPGLRRRISDYNPNFQDQVRRAYIQKGPCQPKGHNFPFKKFGKSSTRRFNRSWFNEFPSWLEYSIVKDQAFCLCCYLFKPESGEQGGGDTFVGNGFSNWKKKHRLDIHVGDSNSIHNQARNSCEALMNQSQQISSFFFKHSVQTQSDYRVRLSASIKSIRYLLRQGLAFRGHDESENSSNQGNFLEFLQVLADVNPDIKASTLKNAPENLKLTSPDIQKDIVSAAAIETTNLIIREMDDALFSVLIDESRDVSIKEQMAVVLRYVDKKGHVVERFIGIEHVSSTTALSLKAAIDQLFSRHGLSISRLRGQGYDGASNMQGEFNGLKSLIMRENECAYFVHCFAHQLQLALVGLAKKHDEVKNLFNRVASVVNVVGASSKRRDLLRVKQATLVIEALKRGEISSGHGLNQETTLQRPCDTRWGSHYGTLLSIITVFSPIIDMLEVISDDRIYSDQKAEASNLIEFLQSFVFVFCLLLMKDILGHTNELSQALQKKDQDIVNAMQLVGLCKQQLQTMRDDGWESLIDGVSSFCVRHGIDVPNMNDVFLTKKRKRCGSPEITNLYHYRVELFYTIIDMQLQELNNRFNETNTELLICLASLSPNELFFAFNEQKLLRLAHFYPRDFSLKELLALEIQLHTYILDMRSNVEFSCLNGISDLAARMVETKKDKVYPLVYLLLTLALILPVATATVERAFSAMNILKNRLRNRMGDKWMNDSMIVFIERDIFKTIDDETIMKHFQNMKPRRGKLLDL